MKNVYAAALTLVLLCCGFAVTAAPPTGRLPHNVKPLQYDLTLTIVPQRQGFSGEETITVEIRETLDTIWLHGNGLNVKHAELALADGETLNVNYEQINENGLVKLALPREVEPQEAALKFAWDAEYSEELDGLYKVVVDGRAYTFTQFEPIAARKVFPGFDEPSFKTPYDITLKVKPEHAAITTTLPVNRTSLDNGLERIEYATTKPLPTYLIAFAVGPLDVVEAPPIPPNEARSRPLPFRGVAVAGKGGQLAYALEHTPDILAALEDYTGIAYPYQKLDIIAVPNFEAGAMENVGAITFREYLILLDEDAPLGQKRSFAGVMAHELAHFWFGNLVTVPWWNDIWLNEAFASWFGTKGVEAVRPEFRAPERSLDDILYVMSADSLVSARRIRQPIESSDDIYSAFDGITYTKGEAVLRMFEQFVGEEDFQRGVHDYLSTHAHGNGSYLDFIAAVEAASEREIAAAFKSFLNQSGLPLLKVSKTCDSGRAQLQLSQSRYLPLGSSGDRERTWGLPVCFRYGDGGESAEKCLLMEEARTTVALNTCPSWIMPNADAAGYYRWSLERGSYAALMAQEGAQLTLQERMSLADNIRAAVRAGRLPFDEAMALLARFADSSDPLLVDAPLDALTDARGDLARSDAQRKRVQLRSQALTADALVNLTFLPAGLPPTKTLKEMLVGFKLFTARAPQLRGKSSRLGAHWIAAPDQAEFDSAFLEDILAVAVQERGMAAFDPLAAMLAAGLNAHQRRAVVGALGHADDAETVDALHQLIFSDNLRSNEIRTVLRVQARMESTAVDNWEWIKRHFDELVDAMPAGHAGELPGMTQGFCSEKRAAAVEAFFAPRIEALQGGPRNLKQALEHIRICAAVADHQRPAFLEWLSRVPGSGGLKSSAPAALGE